MEAVLRAGLQALDLDASNEQVGQLLEYAALLQKWSRIYNLTALRSAEEIATHHLLDSLAVIGPLRRLRAGMSTNLLDVGSGAGLPGAVIAIACAEVGVDCVDAVAKKAAFIRQVAGSLSLPNLRGIHSRVEALAGPYEVVTSRAFASLADFTRLTGHLVAEGGAWMAMKGKYPADEVAALPGTVEMFHVEQLRVPGLDAERCLVWLRRRGA